MKITNITYKKLEKENAELRKLVDENVNEPLLVEINELKIKLFNSLTKNEQLTCKNLKLSCENETLKQDLKFIKSEQDFYSLEIEKLTKQNNNFKNTINELKVNNETLQEENKQQKVEISRLNTLLCKNIENSSIPSSQNYKKKVYNSREKSTKTKGGQKGHKGYGLNYFDNPSKTIVLEQPKLCPECLCELVYKQEVIRKQIVDLLFELQITEYQGKIGHCPNCGYIEKPKFPNNINNNVQYGNKLKAFATLLTNYGFVSINRTTSIIKEITSGKINLSWATICNLAKEFSTKAKGDKETIMKQLLKELFLHVDETTIRAAGKRAYIFVSASKSFVHYYAHSSRGEKATKDSLLKDYQGYLIHDHYTLYYKYGINHQECNVHILRYLKGVLETEKKEWANKMRTLLLEASSLRKDYKSKGLNCFEDDKIIDIEARYDSILKEASNEYSKNEDSFTEPGKNLQRRMEKYKANHLLFIHNFEIPFDNNLAERMIRPIKTKVKVSGAFGKAKEGANYFCDFRSIIGTAQLQNRNILDTVEQIFMGKNVFEVKEHNHET